jgi:hypothetical protein
VANLSALAALCRPAQERFPKSWPELETSSNVPTPLESASWGYRMCVTQKEDTMISKILLTAMLIGVMAGTSVAKQPLRPNILIIFTDDK